ncbi:1795_t:CDS:2 [Scutellospora calospora]|uniref:1795_t:CDS:1 n=1 Tax=Scutellospora calospora TaxID=85575 RepID=A0ACA9JUI8_9GLOM|nr:1795_t:CDS:2 [Scutellospora calospora]
MDLKPLTKSMPVNQDKLEVSKIMFGTSLFNGIFDNVEKCLPFEAVTRALELVGRYGVNKSDFDYSPKCVRESIEESCRRLKTDYLDAVYAHDVEFVDINEVVEWYPALAKLRLVISKCALYAKENGFNISKRHVEEAVALFNEISDQKKSKKMLIR